VLTGAANWPPRLGREAENSLSSALQTRAAHGVLGFPSLVKPCVSLVSQILREADASVQARIPEMNVSSAGGASPRPAAVSSEAKENPAVPDHDGDADDGPKAVAAKAPPSPGTGAVVDKTA